VGVKMRRDLFFDSGVVLATMTGLLYCASSAKLGGFLGYFYLDADILGRNFQQVLYDGFVNFFPDFLKVVLIYAVLVWFYSYGILPSFNEWLKKGGENPLKLNRVKKKFISDRVDSGDEKAWKARAKSSMCYAIGALVTLYYLASLEREGRNSARQLLQDIQSNAVKPEGWITVKVDQNSIKLVFLVCGDKICAGYDPTEKAIRYFPHNGHSYFYSGHAQK